MRALFACCFLFFSALQSGAQVLITTSVIPAPVSAERQPGTFYLSEQSSFVCTNPSDSLSAALFNEHLVRYYGFRLKILRSKRDSASAVFLSRIPDAGTPSEGYSLRVTGSHIVISAGDSPGIFYGLQTLKQLLPPSKAKEHTIACCTITDYPRFRWRGMMLDVSRHFFTVEEVKQFIDYLAAFKLNTFHWHLTDDQGWRIEIKKYPKLTTIGAWRSGTLMGHAGKSPPQYDTVRYGGFYTQDQIRDVVAYAQARHITVVPEIEMPGHCRAALAAYPELACSGNHFEVARNWGVFEDVMCPTPFTIAFVQNVLSEVMDLFPSRYIHVGGDECPKTRWKESAYCQNLMKELGLNNETQLQSWFFSKMDSFIRSNNRRLIGWDEILDGDLSPEAAVMSWQGIERGISAAKKRHEVVMSPTSHMYFDYYQALGAQEPMAIGGYLPIDTVYAFEPLPVALAPEDHKYILGVQANLWTEYIADFRQAEYMTFPRLCALAEVAWTSKENRNFNDFSMRLTRHLFPMLDRLGVNYSKAIYQLNMEVASAAAGIRVALASRDSSLHIRYRYNPADHRNDSSDPFQEYDAPIHITSSGILHVESSGNHASAFSFSQAFEINKATGKNISLDEPPDAKYSTGGAFTLVNGIEARLPWHGSEWLGFWGRDLMATIDLGLRQHISSVGVGVLEENGSWIYLPSHVNVSVSDDGKQFMTVGELSGREIKLQGGRRALFSFPEVSARYVKVTAINHGLITGGNPGAGFRAWLFVDEIAVR